MRLNVESPAFDLGAYLQSAVAQLEDVSIGKITEITFDLAIRHRGDSQAEFFHQSENTKTSDRVQVTINLDNHLR